MTTDERRIAAAKAQQRAMWALGDYHRFATHTVWPLGPVLVERVRDRAGQRVLDVAAGTGNVAIRAAEAGADVVAADLTPEHFAAGRRAARERGVELDWVEADAEALPVRRRRVRRRLLLARRHLRARPPRRRRRARARVPPGRHDRHGQLHARGPGRRLLRAVRPPRAAASARRAAPVAVGERGARARAVRRPARPAGADPRALRRAQPGRSRPPIATSSRRRSAPPSASTRARRAARAARGARPRLPRLRHAGDQGPPGGPAEYAYEYLLVVGRRAG